ncbi:hypothetical protein P691DRAFT_768497 [Macrolepiota fuliginosa MF-IS2]|uniref:Uncharacterized protein n=1 Tax=Macrolepiota fuliginosa MF-IS2 TaxID=1400762 RepID=A0A9P5WY17_9AGAR|nr:hypothetical protein P691DRAFT_768497 [Macrolepiota fuliginosa MF-IS2]
MVILQLNGEVNPDLEYTTIQRMIIIILYFIWRLLAVMIKKNNTGTCWDHSQTPGPLVEAC